MFDDLKIRNKLILLLAGPLIITLLLSALGARDRKASANESSEVEQLVAASKASSDVVDALQQEALYSSAYVGADREAWEQEVGTARKATDTVLATAVPQIDAVRGTSPSVDAAVGLAQGAAEKLTFYRQSVDQGFRTDQISELVINYGQLEDTFLAVNANINDAVSDPQAAADLRGAAALATYKSAVATQSALLAGAAEAGTLDEKAYDALRTARTAEQRQLELLNSISGLQRKGSVRDAMATESATAFELVRDQAVKDGADSAPGFAGEEVVTSSSAVLADLHEVETALFSSLQSAAADAASSAARAANLFLIAALVAIGAAIAAALLLGRKITQPLRKLTEAADRLSEDQMPRLIETLKNPIGDDLGLQIHTLKPIEIDSNDEIGRLAHSFNEVQRVAGEVAEEQAQLLRKGIGEMFVNLARRNQALLDRQIEFIDELERGEEDPDQLDNLYKLDHLATRMRRNAESLLVLAGAEPPRRRGRPAPLANVVRAALAEVEDFGRIELLSFDEVLVASNAAADLAHLLSELMENATNFSPPETRVEVVGHKTKADGYVISVTDHGIGMSADQIAEANESLARPPLVGLAMSRSLGFIVVGRLAGRHGIAVRMMPSAAGGVTAVVSIPPSLVVDTPGGMADAEPRFEPPARLKPVFEGTAPAGAATEADADLEPADGPAPLAFTPLESAGPATPPPVTWGPPPGEAAPAAQADDVAAGLPERSIFDEVPAASGPIEVPAALAAEVDEAVAPAMPAALSFSAPPAEAPSAPAAASSALEAAPAPPTTNRPFFLEDAAPPRTFGEGASAPSAAPEPAPAPAPTPRLFGGPPPAAPAPTAAPEPVAPAAASPEATGPVAASTGPVASTGLPTRTRGASSPPPAAPAPAAPEAPLVEELPVAEAPLVEELPAVDEAAPAPAPAPAAPSSHLDGPPPLAPRRPAPQVVDAPAPAAPLPLPGRPAPAAAEAPAAPAPAAAAPAAPAAASDAPTTTTSGLTKRVPRSAGASRAIPGSEVERGVSGSRRSPEEIRKMLAQHSAGRQRARTQEPVSAGAPDERESHE